MSKFEKQYERAKAVAAMIEKNKAIDAGTLREKRAAKTRPAQRAPSDSAKTSHLFTPYAGPGHTAMNFDKHKLDDMGRVHLQISSEDQAKIGRGGPWRATVTDLKSGKSYLVRDAACGAPGCRCAARIIEDMGVTYTVHGHVESRGKKSAFWTKTGVSRKTALKLAAEQRREPGGVVDVVRED